MNEDIKQLKKQITGLTTAVLILSVSVFLNTVCNGLMRDSIHEYTALGNEFHKKEIELNKNITDALYSMYQLIVE